MSLVDKIMPKRGPHLKNGLALVVIILIVDQITKWLILNELHLPSVGSIELLPFLSFTMVWNKGISMGLPAAEWVGEWGLIALTFAITIWLMHWMVGSVHRLESVALAMVAGGALGNLIDRFLHGAVVDFVHLHAFDYNFYVFNVADAAISLGVVILLIDGLRGGDKGPKNVANGDDTAN